MGSTKKSPLSITQLESVATLFSALGDPLRLAILQSLCNEPRCVSEIVQIVGTSQANVSKHLAKLVARGVLTPSQTGRNVFYQLANGLPLRLCKLVHSELNEISQDQSQKRSKKNRTKNTSARTASLAHKAPKT
jgi:DNA-binding transcriptional ArsR family regulator